MRNSFIVEYYYVVYYLFFSRLMYFDLADGGRKGDDLWVVGRYERLTKVRPDDATWGDALPPPKLV